ncbi:hypothetical protein ACFLYE_01700 [Chloroflexota bacterium]
MRKQKLLWIPGLTVVLLILFPHPAYAYIDPGTTGNIFAMLAPLIAIFLAFLGFLIRPFREFFTSIVTKLRGGSGAESVADDSPDDEKSGDNTGEEPKS